MNLTDNTVLYHEMPYNFLVILSTTFSDDIRNQRDVINSAVRADVANIFKGKTHAQLLAMEKQIKSKINAGGAIDIGMILIYAWKMAFNN